MSVTRVVRLRSPGEAALELVQREYPTYHPLTALARMAHRKDVQDNPQLELEVHKAILPYTTPKLAVKEVQPIPDDDRRIVVSLFEEAVLTDDRRMPVEIPLLTDIEDVVPVDSVT